MAYIGKTPVIGNFVKLDSITVVNGQAAYTMQNGGVNFTSYDNVNQFLVSLNGVLQAPTDSFTVSSSTLTFASNLSTGDVIDFVLVLGNSLDIGTPSDNTITTAKLSNNAVTNAKLSFNANQYRNIIINGDMSIAQRGTSFTSASGYTLDRYTWTDDSTSAFTITQSTDVPSGQGFASSMKLDCTTANTSLGSSDQIRQVQKIEAQNLQQLVYGTSSAKSLTLSFWVKSNKTGTYCATLSQEDNSYSSFTREYTISSADTWEKKTLTFDGDTSGVINNDNGSGLWLMFAFGAGSGRHITAGSWTGSYGLSTSNQVNLADSTSNELYLTGVQLEAGTSASDFEFLPFDVNQQRCQRYFVQYGKDLNGAGTHIVGVGQWYSASEVVYCLSSPVRMRAKPTMTTPTVSNGYRFHKAGAYTDVSDGGAIDNCDNQSFGILKQSLSGGTGGQATFVTTQSTGAKLQFSAEL
jgi:hypothetical protein